MELKLVVESRHSCRNFTSKPIDKKVVSRLIEMVRLSPSAVNYQPYIFYMVTSSELLEKQKISYPRAWFKNFPLCVVACGKHNEGWHRADGKDHTDIDVAIAVEHLVLAAAQEGLGSCWVCNFDVSIVKKALLLDEHTEPVALIPIGYPDTNTTVKRTNRKSVEELFKFC